MQVRKEAWKKRLIYIFWITLSLICIFCGVIGYINDMKSKEVENLPSILFCDRLKRGMTRNEAEKALASIGDYFSSSVEFDDYTQVQINFKGHYIPTSIKTIILYFNSSKPDATLISITRSTELGDPIDLPECEISPK